LLELFVLVCQNINLPLNCLQLDLCVFGGEDLVLEVALHLQQLSIGLSVLLLLLFVPFDPHFPSFFLASDNLVQTGYLFIKLFLAQLCLSLDSLLLNLKSLGLSLEVDDLFVELFDFIGSLLKSFFFNFNDILETSALFNFFSELYFCFVTGFVGQVQFLNRIFKIVG